MSEPEFVIVSTGRCGSGYIARVLSEAGLTCGHESWWNLHGGQRQDLVGDSSWLAVGHLDDYEGAIYEQVANPLLVLSRLQDELDVSHSGPYATYRRDTAGIELSGDRLLDCIRAYNAYMNIINTYERYTWRLEDQITEDLIVWLAYQHGYEIDEVDAVNAINRVPTNYNSRPNYIELTPDDLPDCPETEEFLEIALEYGYTP